MTFDSLKDVIKTVQTLRDPEKGCPWDLQQNHQTLLKYLIEETYEYREAVRQEDPKAKCDELGDVFLQVLLNSVIAEQSGEFSLEDVANNLNQKLIRRHPHVFSSSGSTLSPEQVQEQWRQIKEKEQTVHKKSLMPEKLTYAPPLHAAHQIGVRSSQIDFDWKNPKDVFLKVEEELNEFKESLLGEDSNHHLEEFGDLLFSIVQWGRHLNLDASDALEKANKKFCLRFQRLEALIEKDQAHYQDLQRNQRESYWKKVKENEKTQI